MARNRLKELESKYGSLEEIIPRLVNEGGQKMAASVLNVSQSTVSVWLKENGYRPVIIYRKLQENPA